jgi:hypothetical protein
MYIDAHINQSEKFEDVTIESLYIILGSQIYETVTIDPESNGYIYKKTYENVKEIHEAIDIADENLIYNKTSFSKDLFFVYIGCNAVPDACTSLLTIGKYLLGVVFDENLLYQRVMAFVRELADKCTIPVGFADFILLWNAFKSSVETEHYMAAIKFYNMLFGRDCSGKPYGPYSRDYSAIISKPCGCHG